MKPKLVNTSDKPVARWTKTQKEKTQNTKIRNESGKFTLTLQK